MRYLHPLAVLTIIASVLVASSTTTVAQEQILRLPPPQVTLDEDILALLVDEPCHHFEAARDQFIAGQRTQAAEHLRIASAYLRLEAARATAQGKTVLDASIRELQRLAWDVDRSQVRSVEVLQQAFARAHYALAGHHCIKSAHRCCRPAAFDDKQEMTRAGRDLKAAAVHLKSGTLWAGSEPREETLKALEEVQFSAEQLIQTGESSPNEVARALRSVGDRLEKLTGLRIMLASPLVENDRFGPSLFR